MMWINYLLEANLYLALFYGAYYLLLRRETYYQLNRAYLLGSSLFAFLIPLLQLGFLKPLPVTIQSTALSSADPIVQISQLPSIPVTEVAPLVTPTNYYLMIYVLIAGVMALSFAYRIIQLARLAQKGKHTDGDNFRLIEIDDNGNAFSFFGYLFISKKLTTSGTIIQHELVHIRQKHSLDIIYLELVKIICWFNPAVYLLQNSIKELHEYIADSYIANAQQDVHQYTDFLISNAYGLPETALTNNFFNKNLLKKRIMMLHQKKSGGLARLKLLVALPLLGGMLCLSTLGFTKDYHVFDLMPGHKTDSAAKKMPPPPPIPPVQQKALKLSPPPPPPMESVKSTFSGLTSHLESSVKYPKMALDKKIFAAVAAQFRLDADGKITDVKIAQGAGSGLDEAVVKGLLTYNKKIEDKPGIYTIGADFIILEKQKMPLLNRAITKGKNYVGTVQITDMPNGHVKHGAVPPPPPVPPAASNAAKPGSLLYIIDPNTYTDAKLTQLHTTFYKQGYIFEFHEANHGTDSALLTLSLATTPQITWAGRGKKSAATFKMNELKKYGYKIVVGADTAKKAIYVHSLTKAEAIKSIKSPAFKNVIAPPPPPPAARKTGKVVLPGTLNHTMAKANGRKDTSYQDRFGRLYANIKYPRSAVEKRAEGPVWATFTVDADHHIQNIKMYGGDKDLINEVKSQIVACSTLPAARVGASYTLPVRFALQNNDGVDIDPPAKQGLGWEIGSISKESHQFFWPVFLNQVVVKAREI